MMDDFAILTRSLGKRYGSKRVLDDVRLQLERGLVHSIVGANGAGKSTLFRILLGFLAPSEGSAKILGHDSSRLTPAQRARIGFVNEEHTLPAWMRVSALIDMQRRQYRQWDQHAFDNVIAHYRLLPMQMVGQLSRGERAGLNLAMAIAQSPDLLILDEPTLGLDVVAKRAFVESLLDSNVMGGCTVIYCSHQIDEIERVADNLVVMDAGRIRASGAPDTFRQRFAHWIADIPFKGPPDESIPGLLEHRRVDGLHHYIVLDQDEGFAEVLKQAGARRAEAMPLDLERAINALLASNHAEPGRH